jgi:hypothetical protein
MRNKIQTCLFLLMSGIFFLALPSCEKDPINNPDNPTPDNPTPDNPTVGDTTNWDLVDFAFRDLVGTFGLDTVGKTKTLQMSYPFNEGDYMVDNFEPQTKQDTMYANGVYHYTGSDESIPRETPYRVTWARTMYDGQEAVRLTYTYDNKDAVYLPNPNTMYIFPGQKGDNAMQMVVSNAGYVADEELGLVAASGVANITSNNAEGTVYTWTGHSFSNPFNVNITANYPKP